MEKKYLLTYYLDSNSEWESKLGTLQELADTIGKCAFFNLFEISGGEPYWRDYILDTSYNEVTTLDVFGKCIESASWG